MKDGAIKGIIFDFGGVISAFDNGIFLRSLLRRTTKTVKEMEALIVGSGLPQRYESGKISSREFFREIVEGCGLAMCEEEFIPAFTSIFTPIEPTARLIRELGRGYRLALLSNTNEWHFEHYIRTVEVFPLFDAVTLSFQVGEMKPGERIYRDVLSKIGLPPEACVFIDDLEENVEGARRLSIHGIRYTDHERLVASLRGLGVVV
jgi:glucose-1-phosphatase